MSLVNYSDSDEDTERPNNGEEKRQSFGESPSNATLKRKREARDEPTRRVTNPPPALPSAFRTLYATNVRTSISDDPGLHGGRRRQEPHVIGHWPSFVYLEWLPSEDDLACLDQLITEATDQLHSDSSIWGDRGPVRSSLRSELGVRLPLHVSLSAPLTLTTDNKDNFDHEISKAIQDAKLGSFCATPSSIRWVSNFEKSRYFLILTLAKPEGDQLQTLLSICNAVARKFNLPELYAHDDSTAVGVSKAIPSAEDSDKTINPLTTSDKFHLSIAWTLVSPVSNTVLSSPEIWQGLLSARIRFEEVCVKIGNRVTTVPFIKSAKQND